MRHAAGRHHRDFVGEIDGLADIMGDEERGGAAERAEPQQIVLQLLARQRVERGERLVEQQQVWITNQRAGDGDAALLPAGKLGGPAHRKIRESDPLQQVERGILVGDGGAALQRDRQQDVVERAQPVEQGRRLEDEAGARARAGQRFAADADCAFARHQQPGGELEQGGLAAAAAAEQAMDLASRDRPVDGLNDRRAGRIVAVIGAFDRDETGFGGISRHRARTLLPRLRPIARSR